MNWFQRHLNWTWVLGYLLLLAVGFVVEVEFAIIKASLLIVGIPMLFVSLWVLERKQRSLWWILLSGIYSPLWLANKKTKPEPVNS